MSERGERALAFALLGGAAAIAWAATVAQARAMDAMPGCTGAMGLGPGAFLVMWSTMMTAMMLPAVAPVAVLWSRAIRRRAGAAGRLGGLALFAGGYLAVWSALGAVAFVACRGLEGALARAPGAAGGVAAAIFAAAGAWQLTPWKAACLHHCRSPLAHLAHYTAMRGPLRDLRIGAHHGLACAACCWALMALLAAVGLMNLPAMLALAVFVWTERSPRLGPGAERAASVALFALAALAPFVPALHAGLGAPDLAR